MTTKLAKRWDSSSRTSLEKEATGGGSMDASLVVGGGISNAVNASSGNASAPLVSLEEENRSLRKRLVQLEAENERLKASVFLLTEKLNGRKPSSADSRLLSMDALLCASSLQQQQSNNALNSTSSSSPVANGLVPAAAAAPRQQQQLLGDIFTKSSREWTTGGEEDSSDDAISNHSTSTGVLSCRTTLAGHSGAVYACKFSPDGSSLASTSLDCTVRLWNATTGTSHVIGQHTQSGSDLAWLGQSRLVSASLDMTVKVWDAVKFNSSSPVSNYKTNGGVVLSVASSSDHHSVFAGASSGTIHRFDMRAPTSSAELLNSATGGDGAAVNALTCGEGVVFSGDAKGRLRAWDLRISRPDELFTVEGRRPISGIAYSANGYLAVNAYDSVLRVFCKGGSQGTDQPIKLVYALRGHRSKTWPIRPCFSHQQHTSSTALLLATGSSTNSCYLFGHLPATPPSSSPSASSESLSSNVGESAATGGVSLVQQLHGHLNSVYSCDFSPVDNHLATCSADNTLKIWWKRW